MPMSLRQVQMIQKACQERPNQTLFSIVVTVNEVIEVLKKKGVLTDTDMQEENRSNFVSQMLEKKGASAPEPSPTKRKKGRMH